MMNLLAYIDPGAGSLLIQAVIATILVVPFFLREQIRRGFSRLRGRAAGDVRDVTTRRSDEPDPPVQP